MAKPLYLLSNDDGVHAPGINVLGKYLRDHGDVMIAAPHLERSASSSAITIDMPILVDQIDKDVFGIRGTPADSMMLALKKLVPRDPDWVISGINRGGNLGTDTIYSGTVGAAIEGCLCGVPAMAVSIEGREPLQYKTAAIAVGKLLQLEGLREAARGYIINVNVPNLSEDQINGFAVSNLGVRIYHDLVDERRDPRGKPYFWLGPGAKGHVPEKGTDCVEIHEGYVTVTALKPELFDRQATEQLREIVPSVW